MPNAENITAIELDTFNTVVAAVSFNVEGVNYYAFYSRSYGFDQMNIFVIIDENGAIAKMDAEKFIFEESDFLEYGHSGYTGMPGGYTDGFAGVTDEWNGDAAVITGATMTTNAVKQAVNDAFAAFDSIKGGEQ